MWYEAVQEDESLVLIYHPVWEKEIHPNPILHRLYSAFRAVYYGLPLLDIEYIQININREDGTIRKVRYETSVPGDYYRVTSPLRYVFVNKDNGTYSKKLWIAMGRSWKKPRIYLCLYEMAADSLLESLRGVTSLSYWMQIRMTTQLKCKCRWST